VEEPNADEKPEEKETLVLTDGWTFATPEALRGNFLISGVSASIEEITDHPELEPAILRDVSVKVAVMLNRGESERRVINFLAALCDAAGDTPLIGDKDFMVR